MTKNESSPKPSINVEGDVKDSNIIIGDSNIVTVIRNYIFRDTRQLIVFVVIFLLVSSGIAGAYWYSQQPQKMTGNYNIAIAQFGEIQADGKIKPSSSAEKISSTLFDFLDSEYQASGLGLDVQVAHKNMPLIQEDSQAKKLAEEVHADIVIYGNVFVQNNDAEFSPRFYVAEHPDTRELTGQEELAYPIPFNISELSIGDDINAELRVRTEILFSFTKALIYFSQNDMNSSLQAIQTAISAAEKLDQAFAGEEVLYLVAAKVYLKQKDYDNADQMLHQALALNPQYARAYLGRGNMYYAQGAYEEAKIEYELAYQAPGQPEGAYIPIKAHTGLGNVLVVLAQNAKDPVLFAEATEHYRYVINEYERTKDPILRSYTAISYFGLGAAYERQNKIDEAIEAYQQAYSLTDDQSFKERITKEIEAAKSP
jgi:predicted negative regulator of RcsB-dependent stress response